MNSGEEKEGPVGSSSLALADLAEVPPFLWKVNREQQVQLLTEKVEESATVSGHAQAKKKVVPCLVIASQKKGKGLSSLEIVLAN